MSNKVVRVITAITGDSVAVCRDEIRHAQEHFMLPELIFLELLELVLRDPDEVRVDETKSSKTYHLFYRLENRAYICAVVKVIASGSFLASMYPTGSSLRNSHKKLRKLKL